MRRFATRPAAARGIRPGFSRSWVVARGLLCEATMEGTSNIDHDRWMQKITHALRSFRMASQLKAEQTQARRPTEGQDPGGAERDNT